MHPSMPASPKDIIGRSFDFIVCGGGTSGCVIASRLARIPNVSVLLVDLGDGMSYRLFRKTGEGA